MMRRTGELLPLAVPVGDALSATLRVGKKLQAGKPALSALGRTALRGGADTALGGAMQPTGETDPTARAESKLDRLAMDFGAGAATGSAIPVVTGAGRWIGKEIDAVTSAKVRKAADELRTGIKAETGKVLTGEERKIAETTVKEAETRAQAAEQEASVAKATTGKTAADQESSRTSMRGSRRRLTISAGKFTRRRSPIWRR